ncbi:uncharacterized protein LOC135147693 [Daucus carota subsp. sativus]|uniref:uncharacterized protein LOC135147693 n=1 Tax=Daucus carota subsp. sativus TaxID=79200 RepID=UPI003083DF34
MYPSLMTITLYRLEKLEEWAEEAMSTGSNDQSVFPKLESLEITYCPRLRKIPNSCFPSLKELKITDLDSSVILETMSKKVTSLKHLELLNIRNGGDSSLYSSSSCSNMDFIIEEMLKNNSLCLTSLRLIDCGGLKCPRPSTINLVEGSVGLKDIEIRKCPSSFLERVFAQTRSSTLERLSFGPFSEDLDEFPWPFSSSCVVSFHSLKKLSLDGWKKVESIFGQLDNRLSSTFPALTELRINNFKGVKALSDSIARLPSLEMLLIFDCENLKTLPLFEKSHPLQLLETEGCPLLREKYKKGWPEWFKIQHIPLIHWEEDF